MAQSSGAERAYDDVGNRWWALPASASREERVQRGREAFISGGVRGGAMVGALGVCAHFLATFKSDWYKRRMYMPGKVFLLSSCLAAGWWVFGEHEFRYFILQQADIDELARRELERQRGTRFVTNKAMRVINEAAPIPVAAEPASPLETDSVRA